MMLRALFNVGLFIVSMIVYVLCLGIPFAGLVLAVIVGYSAVTGKEVRLGEEGSSFELVVNVRRQDGR
jgi:hypothetical protein